VLNLERGGRVILTAKGIVVKGHWGRMDLGSLGDGYRSTITWVLDLLAWKMLSRRTLDPRRMAGIVLIDEVEQHLHPRWQLRVMELLNRVFPLMQFIATTHSPLVVSGCRHCRVHTLHRGRSEPHSVQGWLAEDVYREVMGLPTSRPGAMQARVSEFEKLHFDSLTRKLSSEKRRRMKALAQELALLPERDPISLTTKLANLAKRLEGGQGSGSP
jgi:predicted ATP-binding protein involved in virulence